jgi:hypothetical protein
MTSAVRQSLHSSDSHAQKRRSAAVSFEPLHRAAQNAELVAKSEDLNLKCSAVAERSHNGHKQR